MLPLILLAFVVVPIVEITVIGQVQAALGWPTTIVILVLDSIVGAYLVRLQGALAWRNFTTALNEGRLPAEEVVDGALILFGGALMLTPGFVTDGVGLICVFTPTRKLLNTWLRGRAEQEGTGAFGSILTIGQPSGQQRRTTRPPKGRFSKDGSPGDRSGQDQQKTTKPPPPPREPGVIDIEVVDVRRNDDGTPGPDDDD